MMHAREQDPFMVRPFEAIDRLLRILALAHTFTLLALREGKEASFRDQAIKARNSVPFLKK